ncbi:MAG: hypothetical protein IMF19_12035 [Proteobacteria bacterium]|nr:hypothetical protein [Pseudomonadota bacterium]
MSAITIRILKAIEDGKVEYIKLTVDYKRAYHGLKYKWVRTYISFVKGVKNTYI